MRSVYIHIPFCNHMCSYCDFTKIYYNKKYIRDYLVNLEKEIKARYTGETIDTIYIGGGTPTSLSLYELKYLMEIIKIFNVSNGLEFTIESNIESIDEEKLLLFYTNKVNRLSFGVQSFNEKNLKTLNRQHTKENVFEKIEMAKRIGFTNLNIDLIYGVNNNFDAIKEDIGEYLKLDIPHISCYSLIIEDNTILGINNYKNIEEDIEYEMYKYIKNTLEKNNYIHYEISNYAKEGYKSLHNINYWQNGEYYGFGLGAVSYINCIRRMNTKSLTEYLIGNYSHLEEYESFRNRCENDMILGLRKINGVKISDFETKYDKKIEEVFKIDNLLKEKKLIKENGYIRINEDYLYVSNDILINFLK